MDHDLRTITERISHYGSKFTAGCKCGTFCDAKDSRGEAILAWEDHKVEARRDMHSVRV